MNGDIVLPHMLPRHNILKEELANFFSVLSIDDFQHSSKFNLNSLKREKIL